MRRQKAIFVEWDRLNENRTTKIWNSQNDGFFHNNRDRPSDEHGRDDFRIYTTTAKKAAKQTWNVPLDPWAPCNTRHPATPRLYKAAALIRISNHPNLKPSLNDPIEKPQKSKQEGLNDFDCVNTLPIHKKRSYS